MWIELRQWHVFYKFYYVFFLLGFNLFTLTFKTYFGDLN